MANRTNLTTLSVVSVFLVVLAASATAAGETIYVDADAGGANNGSSWTDAYRYLQNGLAAAWSGDEIRVAQGIYKPDQGVGITPGDRTATFQLKNGITIKGGYAGFGEPDPNDRDIKLYETILSGDLNGDDVDVNDPADLLYEPTRAENSHPVVSSSNCERNTVLDGVTITGGNGYTGSGGGMSNSNSSPTVTNCTFSDNSVYMHGGGMLNWMASNPTVTNCTFNGNYAHYYGGGMYNGDSPTVTNCTFSGNTASRGGGMYNTYGWPMVTNCIFSVNHAMWGGGMFNGDLGRPTVVNCTFSKNSGSREGGGIYNYHTFLYPTLTNCILWGNTPDQISGSAVVTYSDVQGGWEGEGNIDADPCFVEPGWWDPNGVWVEGDYHLLADSPCINAGDPNYVPEPNETDLDGKPRVIGGRIDMGAYEYANTAPIACIVGGNRIVEAQGTFGARVTLDGSCSSDADSTAGTNDDIVSFDWYKVDACDPNFEDFLASGEIIDCNLPLGEHIIILEVIDKAGAFDTNEVTIIVQDTTPPEFTLSVTPDTLWPANHKMVLITPTWTASDICDDSPEVTLVSITMNEGDETKGSGHTTDDIQIGDDGSIYLRAERSASGSGRVYTITYQAIDDSGNAAVASATVAVPHDQR